MNSHLGAPIIETSRLYCRIIDLCDLKDMFEICSDQEVTKYLTFEPHTNYRHTKKVITNMIRSYLANESINYAIICKENRKMIASMSITFLANGVGEIGYLMHPDYWNHGFMFEAVTNLIDVCFQHYQLQVLKVRHIVENFRSEKLIQKLGFHFDFIEENAILKANIPFSIKNYSLSQYEYYSKRFFH